VLTALVKRTLELVRRALPCDVKVHIDVDAPVTNVRGVAIELEQLLLNLVLNACDAMPEGGELWVSVRPAGPSAVMLEVSDSGVGFADASGERGPISRSSKAGRPGGGLGLGIVRSVVERHGATLLIGPRPGGGTRVLVRLPGG